MKTLSRRIWGVSLLGLGLILNGCSSSAPTSVAEPDSRAVYDNGVTFGSGSRSDGDTSENRTAADSGSAARNGVTFGSGS